MRASIILPIRNEEAFLESCLSSLLIAIDGSQDEILVVDGCSEDRSRAIVEQFSSENIRLLTNQKKLFAAAVNVGIAASTGQYILIVGAHANYPFDYVERCLGLLEKYRADNAGGRIETAASGTSFGSHAIAYVLSHPFGVGRSQFRVAGPESGILKDVETVFGGCYPRDVFDRNGGFDERLHRTADKAFNHKLVRGGGKIVMDTTLSVTYFPRTKLREFIVGAFRSGYWAGAPLGLIPYPTIAPRQLIPGIFAFCILLLSLLAALDQTFLIALILLLVLYSTSAISASKSYAGTQRRYRFLFLPPVFLTLHLSFGFGFLTSLPSFLRRKDGWLNLATLIRRQIGSSSL